MVPSLLTFLGRDDAPRNGEPVLLNVLNQAHPNRPPEVLEFASKSSGRMRICRQNRHSQARLSAWAPECGFPQLKSGQKTPDAAKVLKDIGGVHIFLARASDGAVWAGFTKGEPSPRDRKMPFAQILWGSSPGGYWRYEENADD